MPTKPYGSVPISFTISVREMWDPPNDADIPPKVRVIVAERF